MLRNFQVGAVIVYTFVYHMLAPPPPVPDFDEKKPLVITVEDVVEETRESSLPQMTFDDSLEAPLLHPRPKTPSALVKVCRDCCQVLLASINRCSHRH